MSPSDIQAEQFAIMLAHGLPASQAILYFVSSEDPGEIQVTLNKWLRTRAVQQAITRLQGKAWQEMSLDEKMNHALTHHYAGLAYFLLSHNYAEVSAQDKAKADSARQAIEAKLAGVAGKGDALTQFFSDIREGKLKLGAKGSASPGLSLPLLPS